MADFAAEHSPNRCPTHPGELLRDVIPATGKSKAEIAALLGISRQHLYDILKERKPVSPSVAVRLGKLFGDGAGRARYLARRARIGRRDQKNTEAEDKGGVRAVGRVERSGGLRSANPLYGLLAGHLADYIAAINDMRTSNTRKSFPRRRSCGEGGLSDVGRNDRD